jgi:hypothetical protein
MNRKIIPSEFFLALLMLAGVIGAIAIIYSFEGWNRAWALVPAGILVLLEELDLLSTTARIPSVLHMLAVGVLIISAVHMNVHFSGWERAWSLIPIGWTFRSFFH